MAPRTRASAKAEDPSSPTVQSDNRVAKRPAPGKPSEERVAKRPARGYHTFKNGMLNVTPKGDEQELVKHNRNSPLLRLPAEVRNQIWEFALGGMTFRQQPLSRSKKTLLRNSPRDTKNATALLRVCRQVFAETALLLYQLNNFSLPYYWNISISTALRRLRAHQRRQIKKIQVEFEWNNDIDVFIAEWFGKTKPTMGCAKWLPNLRCIQACFFKQGKRMTTSFDTWEKHFRSELEADMCSKGYELSVKEMEMTWNEYDDEWCGNAMLKTDSLAGQ